MAEDLPQITNESELREAMNGPKTMYAVLNAPVSGSAVDDPFELLTYEYFTSCIWVRYIKMISIIRTVWEHSPAISG